MLADKAEILGAFLASRRRRELKQCMFEAFDELGHEREIESIDGVAGTVIAWIPKKGSICDHECWQARVPE